MADLVIHIGYPKAGSSWLQEIVFNSPDFGFASVPRHDISLDFGVPGPFEFNPKATHARYEPLLAQAEREGRVLVLSQEFLAGNGYLNGGVDAREYADRLKAVFPHARILIVIREQSSFLLSFYKMDVCFNGGFFGLEEFLEPKWNFSRRSQFLPRYVKYDGLISHYFDLFGRQNVLVLLFELLCQQTSDFVERIAQFAGGITAADWVPPESGINVGRSMRTVSLQRVVNRALTSRPENTIRIPPRLGTWLNRGFFFVLENRVISKLGRPDERLYLERIDRLMGDYYKDSNCRTQDLTGLDLARYGYKL